MKKSRRKFLKESSQISLATGFSIWWMSCDFSKPTEKPPTESFLTIAKIFSDNLILQRDQPNLIWGWTNPDATVKLDFDKKEYRTQADLNDGKWIISLPASSKKKSFELIIKQGIHEIEIKNILFGDVYLCGGQSNMEWPMSRVDNVETEIENANDAMIRHFKISATLSGDPSHDIAGGSWEICSSQSVRDFSAAAYFFAKNIRQNQDVPIGLVNATRGGSNIKMWMSTEVLKIKDKTSELKKAINERLHRLEKKYQFSSSEILTRNTKTEWTALNYDDEKWINIQLPIKWNESDFREMLGKIWYRKTFFLKKKPPTNAKININIAQVDDADITFVNGQKVGEETQIYDQVRRYEVPTMLLKKGKNVLSILVENYQAFGGVFGKEDDLFLSIDDEKISLAGDWKVKIESITYNEQWLFENGMIPSVLFNSMISPLGNFRFRGILWYQGESDALKMKNNNGEYGILFKNLISSWRAHFALDNLPFIFAQLSNANSACYQPSESWWARLREAQSQALRLKNTAQVINIDSGKNENSMHPQNKPELGKRFALAVGKLIYQEDIIAEGPVFKKMKKEGKYLHVYFDNIGKALLLKNGREVKELTIAGANKIFLWAKSRVEEDRIVIWHDEIDQPVAVRYAWCDNPIEVNLYNSEELPAAPFRTDDW